MEMAEAVARAFRTLGAGALGGLRSLGRAGLFLATAAFWALVPPLRVKRLVRQVAFIGARSSLIVLLTGTFTGMVLALESYHALQRFGGEMLLGPGVALALIREIGPVISALMITARAGSALTAELGIMRITEQIDALEVMAINPFRYLIVPNLLAGLISFPLLTSMFDVVGIYGGYLVAVKLLKLSEGCYFGSMSAYVDMGEVLHGLYKSVCFGLIVMWVCCYKGFHASYGAEGVSKATTEAVVTSSVLVLVADYVIASLVFS